MLIQAIKFCGSLSLPIPGLSTQKIQKCEVKFKVYEGKLKWYSDCVLGRATEESRYESWQPKQYNLISEVPTPGLGLTQSHNQWVPGVLHPGVKWPVN